MNRKKNILACGCTRKRTFQRVEKQKTYRTGHGLHRISQDNNSRCMTLRWLIGKNIWLDRIGYKKTAVMKQLIDKAINTEKET